MCFSQRHGVNFVFHFVHSNKKPAKKDGDIFEAKKEEYKPSEQRKTDQAAIDKQILEVIAKHPDAAMLKAYMQNILSLSKGQFPHLLKTNAGCKWNKILVKKNNSKKERKKNSTYFIKIYFTYSFKTALSSSWKQVILAKTTLAYFVCVF